MSVIACCAGVVSPLYLLYSTISSMRVEVRTYCTYYVELKSVGSLFAAALSLSTYSLYQREREDYLGSSYR